MKNIIGIPVSSNDFFGREREIELLRNFIENRQSVYLYACRRMGKTSLLKKLMVTYEEQFEFKYINELGNLPSENYLIEHFNLTKPQGDYKFRMTKNELLESIKALFPTNKTQVFIIDEFVYLIEQFSRMGNERLVNLLELHRFLRQQTEKKIVFIYAGEEKLNRYPILNKYLNDVKEIVLHPLSKEQSFYLIEKLAFDAGIEIAKNTSEKIFNFSNGVPYNIQLLFSHILIEIKKKRFDKNISNTNIDLILSKALYELKQYQFHPPPQNDKFQVEVNIDSIIDLTNKK